MLDRTRPSLLSRVRDHDDHVAWREFDAQYRDLILRHCYRRGLQASDAEDVRQMVMLNLARQLRTFQYQPDRGRFRDYLGRAVRNGIHRYFRRPRPEFHGLDMEGAADTAVPGPHESDPVWEAEWMHYHYRRAMDTVRRTAEPKSVAVFEHLLAGETPDEVAAAFSMTRDAVHKVKQRMRDRLKAQIVEQIREESDAEPRAAG